VKEGECWRIRTNTEIQGILHGESFIKFVNSLRLRCYGHVERTQNRRMPKQIATVKMERTRKSGKPRKRWTDNVEEDLNIRGIKSGRQWPETVGHGGRFYWKPRSTTDGSA
jgi:hypothetical protein